MTKFEDGGIITCQFYARLDASFALDPAVIPADAVYKPKPLPTRRWTVADGPYGKTIFSVIYNGDRARTVGVYTKMSHDAAQEVCAYARRVLALPDTITFKEKWTAYTPHSHAVDPHVWIKGFHGNAPVQVSLCEKTGCIRAPTFSDLQHVAAAIMHQEPFAPVGKRFFGMDSDELRRISQCATENTTFQWYTYADSESDEFTPNTDGWPPIHDGVLAI
jgi:hypothetical protein